MRKRHLLCRLQPVLLVIGRVRRRLDHVEGISESSLLTPIAFRLMQDTSMDDDQIAYVPIPWPSLSVTSGSR